MVSCVMLSYIMLFAFAIVYYYNSTPQRYDIYKYQPSL